MEKAREFQKNIYFRFIDYVKVSDCVDHNNLWKIHQEMGLPDHLTAEETIHKTKRPPAEREKMFANQISDKELTFKNCKELIQLNSKKPKHLIKK